MDMTSNRPTLIGTNVQHFTLRDRTGVIEDASQKHGISIVKVRWTASGLTCWINLQHLRAWESKS